MPTIRTAAVMLGATLAATLPATGQERTGTGTGVVVYRCTARDGALSLRDTPCPPQERQQVMNLRRPQDPPPPAENTAAAPPAPAPTPTPPAPEVRYVHVAPPRPMYECVTPEGERYTSDDDSGNPRWMAYWAYAHPAWPRHPRRPVGGPNPPRPPPPGGGPGNPPVPPARGIVPAGGTLVRDQCHMLPQQETCARLSDRRWEILRRYNSAMPGERRDLEQEQRGIDARIANDC